MRIRPAFLLFTLLLAACLSTPQPPESGIEGTVTIGPSCPVVQENVPCPDKPYQAAYTVFTTTGTKVTAFQTDEQGRFQINLAPGDYVLHLESPQPMQAIQDMPFSVAENTYTLLNINYDSGIR
jgi:hypothetical protein